MALASGEITGIQKLIDATILRPTATEIEILELVNEGLKYGYRALCVAPFYVPVVRHSIQNARIEVVTVVGFPFGSITTKMKLHEVKSCLSMGATELDVVPNIGAYLGGDIELAETEIRTLSDTAKRLGAKAVKVIIETGYMTERQIEELSLMIVDAGADYVKTSTGYGPRGASVRDIEIIRNVVGGKAKIKAAGGIRTLDQAIELIKAGASVLGTSSAKSLVEEASRRAS